MTMMMSFYKKSLHSFLSFTDNLSSKPSPPFNNSNPHLELHHASSGLGLINSDHNNAMQSNKSPNILESSSLIKPPLSSSRKDPGGVGFMDDVGGGVDGLMSCTESLGFESSDERLVNDELTTMEDNCGGWCMSRVRRRKVVTEERKFPPPLTSLNQHGHPNFYLRSVRKDGRLELTEVRIERTEILRACRGDGRLRLHLIKDEEQGEKDGRDGDNEGGIEEEKEEKKEEEEKEEEEEEKEKEEEEVEGLVKEGKMEFRRCVEMINQQRRHEHHRSHHQHHHQHLDVWRQHCVTTS
ncbi:hypothetical protein IC582_011684 [Cucumis melo]|uniref:FAF domain-containing protein n=1 Tax=Cucumis melo TaxID=3656 RepID=A0A9I9CIZ0_CUCME